ncbi:hypothetical protein [Nocardia arizonensis]|uniref:hypothetical protein n=1 Tax=Nocardia arizonensis TaxID=1141647 RepID=UPI0012E2280F|nr:hypothetical protein [Nocardia arizonensis]
MEAVVIAVPILSPARGTGCQIIVGDWSDILVLICYYARGGGRRYSRQRVESTTQRALPEQRAKRAIDAATALSIALFGIATTAVGIVPGMVSDGSLGKRVQSPAERHKKRPTWHFR